MSHYHISGVCGTAMASLAVLLKSKGHKVTGSDQNVYPPMSTYLLEQGIEIMKGYKAENLQPHPDFVVIGNALSRGNPEVEYALSAHLHYLSAAETLKNEFIRGRKSLVMTGTHGKTTTTTMAAHLFSHAGRDTGFMIGGVPLNFDVSARASGLGGYFAVEGDEYDTCFFDKRSKFFHYLPDRLIINNLEFDHADIFDSLEDIKKAFRLMLRQIPEEGIIFVNGDDETALEVAQSGFSRVVTFGFGTNCDGRIGFYNSIPGQIATCFELSYKGERYEFTLPLLGEANLRNITGVILMAFEEGITADQIKAALADYKHVKRRLEFVGEARGVKIFDDFAHHPTAIRETIKGIKTAWPDSNLFAIYEPRSNTSVGRHHQNSMAGAFSEAQDVTFYRLHRGERLAAEERLDLDSIIKDLQSKGINSQQYTELSTIVDHVEKNAQEGDIILVMSQGAFEELPKKILSRLVN